MNQLFKKTFLATLTLLIILTFSANAAIDTISDKVFIGNTNVSGKTKTEAFEILKHVYEPMTKSTKINLKYNGQVYVIDSSDIDAHYDYTDAVNNALKVEHPVKPNQTQVTTDSAVTTDEAVTTDSSITPEPSKEVIPKTVIKLSFLYNKTLLTNYLKKLALKINTPFVDAVMTTKGKKFSFSDSKNGTSLNISKAVSVITKAITPGKALTVNLPVDVIQAKYTKDSLLAIKGELGEFSTSFRGSSSNRVNNISVAASNINNIIIMPGEIFSANKQIGPRLQTTGFKLAHVIVSGKFVDGIGGGICQVSTTLYNAVLKSGLKIVERTHHSIPSTYVPVGLDATISGTEKDLKFQNNTGSPLYITNDVKNGRITFKIYGKNPFPNRTYKIKTQMIKFNPAHTIRVKDYSLRKGIVTYDKSPHPGYIVKSYRETYEKGKLISTEQLYLDKYPTISGIIKVGAR